jgi:hypothetical protein
MAKTNLPIIEQRRIEASIIKAIYQEMVTQIGAEQAKQIIGRAVVKDAVAQGQSYAAELTDGEPNLESFHDLQPQWTANGALEVEMLSHDNQHMDYNVTRCRYAEMYKEMGLAEIGHLLSCGRDGTFCTGYNPSIKLERSQTIMQGATHCDFRYRWEPEASSD